MCRKTRHAISRGGFLVFMGAIYTRSLCQEQQPAVYTYHPRVQLASTTNTVPVSGTKVSCRRYKVPRGTHRYVDIKKVSRPKEDSSRTPVSATIDVTSDAAADIICMVNGKRLGSVPL